jgi:hypothetical protein
MMEYRQPVARSKAVRFLICRRDGLVRRTIHRRPSGQPAALLSRCVISATCLSSCTTPSWSTAVCQALAGSSPIACSARAGGRLALGRFDRLVARVGS